MDRSKIILTATVGIIIVIIVALIFVFKGGSSGSSQNKITILIPGGGTVSVNDFKSNAALKYPAYTAVEANSNFAIVSYGATNGFQITISKAPAQANRDLAEAAFLKDLGINKSDACKLTVELDVTQAADPKLTSKNWGLSFCPNGVAFPTK